MMGRKPTEPRQPVNQKGTRPGVPPFGGRKLKPASKQPEGFAAYAPSWPSVPQKGPSRPQIRTKQPQNHAPVPPTAKRKSVLPGRPGKAKPRGYAQMMKMRERILTTDEEDSQQLSQVQDDVMSAMKIATGLLGGMSAKKKKQQQQQQQHFQHPHARGGGGGFANPMFEFYRNQAHVMKRGPGHVKIKIAKTPRRPLVPAPPPSMPTSHREYLSYQAVKRQGRLATIDPYNAERVVDDALREYNKQNYQIGVVADETIASLTSELMKTMQDCERTVLLLQRLEDEVVPYRNAHQSNHATNAGPAYNPHFAATRAATYAHELPPVRQSHQELGGLKALLARNGSNGNTSSPPPNMPTQSMPVFSYINSPSNNGASSQRFFGNNMSTPNQSSSNFASSAAPSRSNVHINNNLENMDDEKSVLSEAQKSLDQINKQLAYLK